MTDLIVGCPVANRTWILKQWKRAVETATPSYWRLRFVFVVPDWDKETLAMLQSWNDTKILRSYEPERKDERNWGEAGAFQHMADLRNKLLREIRNDEPDLFLSLDSDILLHPQSIANMKDTLRHYDADAVGGATYLDQIDPTCTNVAMWKNQERSTFRRLESDGTHPADVIMAIKLMAPGAYNIDYQDDRFGEDFGWCKAMRDAGKEIYYDGRVRNKHVMSPYFLDVEDKRCGY